MNKGNILGVKSVCYMFTMGGVHNFLFTVHIVHEKHILSSVINLAKHQ